MYIEKLKESLVGERIVLRKFVREDNEAVYAYGSDLETMKYLKWVGVQSIKEADEAIDTYYLVTPGVYAIALKENDVCIGSIDIRVDEENDKADFGYVLDRRYWNQGYMSEALFLVLKHCFEDVGLQRVEATHYKENIGSGRVMQKCGMQYEGLGRREVKIKGKYQDVVHYAILKEDFLVYNRVMK